MSETPDTIILVDDDPLILRALERSLRKDRYCLVSCTSGWEALHALKNQEVSAIISDQVMPEMSGADVLHQAHEISPDTARLLVTGYHDMDVLVEAVNRGKIFQFILKPWKEHALRQIVRAAVEKSRLKRENRRLQSTILQQHQALSTAHDSLRNDLKIGARVHDVLLIDEPPKDMEECQINVLTCPSKDIDGDFYEFYHSADHTLDVVLGDVMGKGVPAALVGTAVKSQFMRFAVPAGSPQSCHDGGPWMRCQRSPAEILGDIQQELSQNLIDLEFFVTLFYGRFDFVQRRFSFIDCGSTKPVHYRPETGELNFLQGPNFPLGMVATDHYQEVTIPFLPGDLFLFYSDGVTETRNPDNVLYGDDRLVAIIKNYAMSENQVLLHMIEQSARRFGEKEKLEDDLTLLIVRISEDWVPESLIVREAKFCSDLCQLPAVREFVDNLCKLSPTGATVDSDQLQLAINEAFCNVTKHSYHGDGDREIVLKGEISTEGIRLTLRDQGDAFDPSEVSEPSLAGDLSGGFGVYILRQVADELCYTAKTADKGWNQLSLFKSFHERGPSMKYSHESNGDVLVVTLESQNLDAKEAPGFKESIQNLISEEQRKHIVFDLKELQFIDSSGLGAFLSVLRHVNGQGGDLRLAGPTKPIRTMLEIVRMHKLFDIFNSTDDAVRSFEG